MVQRYWLLEGPQKGRCQAEKHAAEWEADASHGQSNASVDLQNEVYLIISNILVTAFIWILV